MSAQTTRTPSSVEVQPYTTDPTDGRVYCGACCPPVAGAHVGHIDQRRWVCTPTGTCPISEDEWRASTLIFVPHCDRCGTHPADFPKFDMHGTATVEHVACRIF